MSAVVPLEVRVEQARRAAAAGHFRMAELYAGRALQLVSAERAQCRKDMGIANRRLRGQRMGQGSGAFFGGVMEIFQETLQPVVDFYFDLAKQMVTTSHQVQKDYILTSQVEHPSQRLLDALIAAHPSLRQVEHRDQRLLDVMYAMQAGEVLTEEQRRFL